MCLDPIIMALDRVQLERELHEYLESLYADLERDWRVKPERIKDLRLYWPRWQATFSKRTRGQKTYWQVVFSVVEPLPPAPDGTRRHKLKALLGIVRAEKDKDRLKNLWRRIRVIKALQEVLEYL